MPQTKTRKATKATKQAPAIMIRASKHVQYSADVLIYIGILARRLAKAPTQEAVAGARLFINALHPHLPSRATEAEGETALALVLERIKEAKGGRPERPGDPVNIEKAFELALTSGTLADFCFEKDHFEAILKAVKYLNCYRMVCEWNEAPPVTLQDGARFIGILRNVESQARML